MWRQDTAFNCSNNHEKAKNKPKQISILWNTISGGSTGHIHVEQHCIVFKQNLTIITFNDRPQNQLYSGKILNADMRPSSSTNTSL